jgi:site-specific recombinase XerD
MLQRACKAANVRYGRTAGGITWHTATRATGATRMLRDRTDLRTVQQVGNWKDIRSVQSYLETDTRAARRAVNRIGGVTGT